MLKPKKDAGPDWLGLNKQSIPDLKLHLGKKTIKK